ncbi:DUF2017 domain-containing protein [Rhodococcus sp. IEGM 1408]|uniref:DUF2017 domain-containing protein n=1 Tax=Rhodococcus sp. IEGM 1408 TaxID=3082220 RepID=UPI00295479B8|nr:DUF2017 domain-containing protein [Rhodococcus sp. IEGM 1408]MDV8000808.1 DUF2017 domain-containing protein [Rhodococcus sp. IEGM 1408]
MKAWQRKGSISGPRIKAAMEAHEVQILHALVSNIVDMLEQRRDSSPRDELAEITGMRSGHSELPDQAPLARLLPDFHRPEPGEASDADGAAVTRAHNAGMRMIHEPAIIDAKLSAAAVVLRSLPSRGGTVSLNPEQAQAWMRCLNDVRLGLGALLLEHGMVNGVPATDIPEDVPEDDPRSAHLDVYHWLTFMQDSLCSALTGP